MITKMAQKVTYKDPADTAVLNYINSGEAQDYSPKVSALSSILGASTALGGVVGHVIKRPLLGAAIGTGLGAGTAAAGAFSIYRRKRNARQALDKPGVRASLRDRLAELKSKGVRVGSNNSLNGYLRTREQA